MPYVTDTRFSNTVGVPISLPQTELKRSKSVQIAQWNLETGQKLVLKSLSLQVVRILTPGVLPVYSTTALGTTSVGLYLDGAITSPIGIASASTVGSFAVNPRAAHVAVTPGLYTVVVSNNTENIDVSVCVSGLMRIYT